jgi:hypothetical protein
VHRRRVRLIPPSEQDPLPRNFKKCSAHMPLVGEFDDADGAHFWMAIKAKLGDSLLPPDLFELVHDATMDLRITTGWVPSATLLLQKGEEPILALQHGAPLRGDAGHLQVLDDGVDALPTETGCGTVTSHALRFVGDGEPITLRNNEDAMIDVGGAQMKVANIFSVEYAWSNCSDGPAPSQAAWVAVDADP